jgi:ribosomal protein L13
MAEKGKQKLGNAKPKGKIKKIVVYDADGAVVGRLAAVVAHAALERPPAAHRGRATVRAEPQRPGWQETPSA